MKDGRLSLANHSILKKNNRLHNIPWAFAKFEFFHCCHSYLEGCETRVHIQDLMKLPQWNQVDDEPQFSVSVPTAKLSHSSASLDVLCSAV